MKITATKPQERVDVRLENGGIGARAPQTVIDVFRTTVSKHGNRPALCYKRTVNVRAKLVVDFAWDHLNSWFVFQGKLDETFTEMNYQQYWQECMYFAKALVQLNVGAFKIVNILGFNSVRDSYILI